MARARSSPKNNSSANLGFDARLWFVADNLRSKMDVAECFRRDLHPDFRGEYPLANLAFNDSEGFRKDDDVRWQFGVPPIPQLR